MADLPVHWARFDELPVRTFHDIVRLRLSVFVEEQDCAYSELDGRDVLPTTWHAWIEETATVVSYLRVYPHDGATWIGRVVTSAGHRGRGLAGRLLAEALERSPRPVRLMAQSHLAAWYAAYGFVRCGDDFLEDGILHTPMRLG